MSTAAPFLCLCCICIMNPVFSQCNCQIDWKKPVLSFETTGTIHTFEGWSQDAYYWGGCKWTYVRIKTDHEWQEWIQLGCCVPEQTINAQGHLIYHFQQFQHILQPWKAMSPIFIAIYTTYLPD